MASLSLGLLANDGDESLSGLLGAVDVRVVKASIAHELGQETSVSGHSRDANAHVGVDLEDFLLMDSQIVRALFQTNKDLKFHFLVKIFSHIIAPLLTTWESDLSPREVDPCFTASFA